MSNSRQIPVKLQRKLQRKLQPRRHQLPNHSRGSGEPTANIRRNISIVIGRVKTVLREQVLAVMRKECKGGEKLTFTMYAQPSASKDLIPGLSHCTCSHIRSALQESRGPRLPATGQLEQQGAERGGRILQTPLQCLRKQRGTQAKKKLMHGRRERKKQ